MPLGGAVRSALGGGRRRFIAGDPKSERAQRDLWMGSISSVGQLAAGAGSQLVPPVPERYYPQDRCTVRPRRTTCPSRIMTPDTSPTPRSISFTARSATRLNLLYLWIGGAVALFFNAAPRVSGDSNGYRDPT